MLSTNDVRFWSSKAVIVLVISGVLAASGVSAALSDEERPLFQGYLLHCADVYGELKGEDGPELLAAVSQAMGIRTVDFLKIGRVAMAYRQEITQLKQDIRAYASALETGREWDRDHLIQLRLRGDRVFDGAVERLRKELGPESVAAVNRFVFTEFRAHVRMSPLKRR